MEDIAKIKPLVWEVPPNEAQNALGDFAVESLLSLFVVRFKAVGTDFWGYLGGERFESIEAARKGADDYVNLFLPNHPKGERQ